MVPGFLVPGPGGMIKGKWRRQGSGLVSLHIKGMLWAESFAVSKVGSLEGQSLQLEMVFKMSKHHNT